MRGKLQQSAAQISRINFPQIARKKILPGGERERSVAA